MSPDSKSDVDSSDTNDSAIEPSLEVSPESTVVEEIVILGAPES